MNFYHFLDEVEEGHAFNPYAYSTADGKFHEGYMSIDWLNDNFGDLEEVDDMIERAATFSEGTVLYFQWLKEQGILK